MIMASAVIRPDGNASARLQSRLEQRPDAPLAFLGERNDQNAVRRRDSHAHDGSHQSRHAERRVGINRNKTMPASAAGNAVMMMKGSSQDWKLTTISM